MMTSRVTQELVNLRQNPLSDFVFDWKSEDPDFKI